MEKRSWMLLPEVVTDVPVPPVAARPEGPATVETYTVQFGRDGKPEKGFVVGRLRDGSRFVANEGDERTLRELCGNKEVIGRKGRVGPDSKKEGRNLFWIEDGGRL